MLTVPSASQTAARRCGTGPVIHAGPPTGDQGDHTAASLSDDVTSSPTATTGDSRIDMAIVRLDTISTSRATYGAAISRFGFAISNLQITGENQSAARGRIMDADFAAETANLSRAQILQQAGTAMVAQANQLPQTVLALLRN